MKITREFIGNLFLFMSFSLAAYSAYGWYSGGIPEYKPPRRPVTVEELVGLVPESLPALEVWVLNHVKDIDYMTELYPDRNWDVEFQKYGSNNVSTLLEILTRKDYALSTSEGIVKVWAYLVLTKGLGRPFVARVQTSRGVRAVGVMLVETRWGDLRLHTFFMTENRSKVINIEEVGGAIFSWLDVRNYVKEGDFLPKEDMWLDEWVKWNKGGG